MQKVKLFKGWCDFPIMGIQRFKKIPELSFLIDMYLNPPLSSKFMHWLHYSKVKENGKKKIWTGKRTSCTVLSYWNEQQCFQVEQHCFKVRQQHCCCIRTPFHWTPFFNPCSGVATQNGGSDAAAASSAVETWRNWRKIKENPILWAKWAAYMQYCKRSEPRLCDSVSEATYVHALQQRLRSYRDKARRPQGLANKAGVAGHWRVSTRQH